MPRYAVFLRGMNLGNRRITNDELCSHLEALGCSDVRAFLASGNVALEIGDDEADAVAARIEAGLEQALGYPVPTFVRTASQLREVGEAEPFAAPTLAGPQVKLQVAFLSRSAKAADRRAVLDLQTEDDALAFAAGELFWAPRLGVGKSELDWRAIDRVLGPVTVRTHRTVTRMLAKLF